MLPLHMGKQLQFLSSVMSMIYLIKECELPDHIGIIYLLIIYPTRSSTIAVEPY